MILKFEIVKRYKNLRMLILRTVRTSVSAARVSGSPVLLC